MSGEIYLSHPTFGLLYRVCIIEEGRELFTTLYAQRLFFLVISSPTGIKFEPTSRTDARILVENRLRLLRRAGQSHDYDQLMVIHKRTFQ
ncbi:PipX family protein [Desertifilum sp. FACHB-1129]|uniref:DUF3539 domain-containing protein n=2 Tax=Desertifilum tharense IPPAS B-1220 TaxID=1781255 RepID=A0A1E5QEH4_9CYAN|nr:MULTISPECIES: PipX family protein [Desertifilum]MDA0211522.1 PipX family protein [Cyanobacteria bacterium FC1]MBD2315028.1 PipX family protein [Desertifilum sp. FACHB-1129]MBD2324708.1 PipX family protein [Desertifilum sp. FACHB-866]MBD2334736.1 PipX family protein [Desertifilum sp. FACHB-868]OEJ72994.1 hypothetical protein BH720_22130 [Desertifilum tharense IPPAS B-1220]